MNRGAIMPLEGKVAGNRGAIMPLEGKVAGVDRDEQ